MTGWSHFRNVLTLGVAVALLTPPVEDVQAQGQPAPQAGPAVSFPAYLQLVAARARSEGVSETTILQTLSGLTENPRVVALDRQQPGLQNSPPPVAGYIRTHVDAARINRGRTIYAQVSGVLPALESRYGVPGKMMLAIWGHETNYGSYMGDFDLARSLATLAYEGRRRELFEGELIALLKMIDRGVPRYRLKGSWAGAFGNPQFLPSVWLRTAQDGDGATAAMTAMFDHVKHAVVGGASSLLVATKTAVREAINLLADVKRMTREDAYMLVSTGCDVRVTQLVDGTMGVHVMIPKRLFTR